MERRLLIPLLFLTAASLVFGQLMQPVDLPVPAEDNSIPVIHRATRNPTPEYRFHIEPMDIAETYYDYFPAGFTSIPLRVQPSPAGNFEGGGVYLTNHITPELGGFRRSLYSYLSAGNIVAQGFVNPALPHNISEGFPSLELDLDTGNPLFSWHHTSANNPLVLDCSFAFDQYHIIGFPGIFIQPYPVIRNPYEIGGEEGNHFIWPEIHLGPSPEEGMKRVFILARNNTPNPDDFPCENVMIAYADYENIGELEEYDLEQWTHITIPQLDEWRANNVRPYIPTAVSREDGHIAVMGHTVEMGVDVPDPQNNVIFLLENRNHGEGEWDLYTTESSFAVSNPIDPATGQGYFRDNDEPYQDMRYTIYLNRSNAAVDDLGNYHFLGYYALFAERGVWFPHFSTIKHIKFNTMTRQFEIQDLYPRGEPDSHYLPWDDPPRFDDNGILQTEISYPCYWWDIRDLFHEKYQRIISDGPYMVALHQDSRKARMFHSVQDNNFASWANAPETYIYLSNDNGTTWSGPIIMNANQLDTEPDQEGIFHGNYEPQLAGMKPAYWYIADNIEMLDDEWGRIHFMFLDQNDYGSSVIGNGPPTGGTIMYTALDVNFETGQYPYPAIAENPHPAPDTLDVSVELERLSWDYVVDTLYVNPAGFRVYFNDTGEFGENDEFDWVPYIEEQIDYSSHEILPDELDNFTTYYWRVIPTTKEDGIGPGFDAPNCPVWLFRTEPIPRPATAENPNPSDDSVNVSVKLERLSWDYSLDSPHINPVGFRVYFNDTGEFGEDDEFDWIPYIDGQVEYLTSEILPEELQNNTTYYWKVIPTTREEGTGEGTDARFCPVWTFTAEPIQYPTIAANPVPADDSLNVSVELERLSWDFVVDEDYVNPVGFRVYFNDTGEFDEEDEFDWVPYIDEQVEYHSTDILPEKLEYHTTYYWKVIPTVKEPNLISHGLRNRQSRIERKQINSLYRGDAQDCPVWTFRTETDTSVDDELPQLVTELHSSYPNPFNPNTIIHYTIGEKTNVELSVYNIRGQVVKKLVDDIQSPGSYRAEWNGIDHQGSKVPSGLYFYRLKTADYDKTGKMMLVK